MIDKPAEPTPEMVALLKQQNALRREQWIQSYVAATTMGLLTSLPNVPHGELLPAVARAIGVAICNMYVGDEASVRQMRLKCRAAFKRPMMDMPVIPLPKATVPTKANGGAHQPASPI